MTAVEPISEQSYLTKIFNYFSKLPFPGTFELLHKEVRGIFPMPFEGGRVDISTGLSQNLQLQNSFLLSSKHNLYSFGGVFLSNSQRSFVHGALDSDFNFQSKGQYYIQDGLVAKGVLQVSQSAGIQVEIDHQGSSYASNLKFVNPTLIALPDGIAAYGIMLASHLQSISDNVSVGVEMMVDKTDPRVPLVAALTDSKLSFIAKYATKDDVLTGNISPVSGMAQISYSHKVNEKVELGTELQIANNDGKKDVLCNIGGKFEFKNGSSFRGLIDSTGKVSALLEERLAPGITFMLSGEIDHANSSSSKFGVGINMES